MLFPVSASLGNIEKGYYNYLQLSRKEKSAFSQNRKAGSVLRPALNHYNADLTIMQIQVIVSDYILSSFKFY